MRGAGAGTGTGMWWVRADTGGVRCLRMRGLRGYITISVPLYYPSQLLVSG